MSASVFCAGEPEETILWISTIRHIFGGAYRRKSEIYGLTVYLCHHRCHIFGPTAVHRDGNQMRRLRRYGQLKCMQEQGWSVDDFIRAFGKNYL